MMKLFIIYLSFLVSFPGYDAIEGRVSLQEEEGSLLRDSVLRELSLYPPGMERYDKEKDAYLRHLAYPWSRMFLEMALSDAREMNDTADMAYCLYNLAVDSPNYGDTLTPAAAMKEIRAMKENQHALTYYFRLRAAVNYDMVVAFQFDKAAEDLDNMEKEADSSGVLLHRTIVDLERILLLTKLKKYDEATELCDGIVALKDVDRVEKFTAYIRLFEIYAYQDRYQEGIEVLDSLMGYLTSDSSGDSDCGALVDANYFIIESDYVLAYCALEDVANTALHIDRMRKYYVDSFMNTNFIFFHYLCYYYSILISDWDSAEKELSRMVEYRIEKGDENGLRNTVMMRSELKFKRGEKDSACFYYQQYLDAQQHFYETTLEEQKRNVRNSYIVKKSESEEQHMLTMVLCATAILLFLGVLSFLKLYFDRSVKVAQEQNLIRELEGSYKAAELLNRDSEMLLLRVRECIGEPLDRVIRNVDRLSGSGLDDEKKKQILSEITENAWNLNTIITEFLNKARTQVGKPVLE